MKHILLDIVMCSNTAVHYITAMLLCNDILVHSNNVLYSFISILSITG